MLNKEYYQMWAFVKPIVDLIVRRPVAPVLLGFSPNEDSGATGPPPPPQNSEDKRTLALALGIWIFPYGKFAFPYGKFAFPISLKFKIFDTNFELFQAN